MNEAELKTRFPNASRAFLQANLSLGDTGKVAELESNPRNAPLGAKEVQRPTGERFLVVVTSVRKRLLDADNLCEKYHIDLCRYAAIIPGDSPDKIKIETGQRKTKKGEAEFTEITIYR